MSEKDILAMVHEDNQGSMYDVSETDKVGEVLELVGAIKTFGFSANFNKAVQARILKSLKEGKKYKTIGKKTWDEFCKYIRISRRKADDMIHNIDQFGEEAYGYLLKLGIREKDIKILRSSETEIVEEQGHKMLSVAGVNVPLEADSKEEISSLISGIVKEKDVAEKRLKQAEREIEKKDEEVRFANEKVAEVLKPFSGDREDYQSSLEQIQRDFDVICTKMHMHWNKADNDRVRESMVTATTFWLNDRMNEIVDAFVRNDEN